MKIKNPLLKFINETGTQKTIILPRSFVAALLVSVFFMAFVITDYWNNVGVSQYRMGILLGTIALGLGWGWLASARVRVEFSVRQLLVLGILLAILFGLNYRALGSVIPWRGDEAHHMIDTLSLGDHFPWPVFIFIMTWALIIWLAWRRPKWALAAGLFFLWQILVTYPGDSQFGDLRYPYFNYWLYALAMHPARELFGPYHEIFYRIVPFLSAALLAWYFQRALPNNAGAPSLLWGLAVGVIPVVAYYASILYLEMPAVFLMTIVCLRAEKLLSRDFNELRSDPGWYALILIGFIKETTLPFLVGFLAVRSALLIWKKAWNGPEMVQGAGRRAELRNAARKTLAGEFLVYLVALVPILYYLVFRSISEDTRAYSLTISNLLNASIYPVMGRAFFEQFGIFLLLFLGGCVLLAREKRFGMLAFYLAVTLGYTVFHAIDQDEYIGYSRFNLFVLPAILAGSAALIRAASAWKKPAAYGLVLAAIGVGLVLSPIRADGTKTPMWGNYFYDTSEHYYPVEDAVVWLKINQPDEDILFAGLYYKYYFDFYFKKVAWMPPRSDTFLSEKHKKDDPVNLEDALEEADKESYRNVLFFVLGKDVPQVPQSSPYRQKQVFSNLAHRLVLYSRD